MVDERHFVFSCGVGIDATVVKRVDAHPRLKSRAGPYYYSWAAVSSLYRKLPSQPGRLRVETDAGGPVEGVTALAQNSDPFTYFASYPIRVCEGIAIDDGTLSLGGPEAGRAARHADPDPPPLQRARAPRRATARSTTSKTSPQRHGRLDIRGRGRKPAPLPGPGRRRLHRRAGASRAAGRARFADGRRLSGEGLRGETCGRRHVAAHALDFVFLLLGFRSLFGGFFALRFRFFRQFFRFGGEFRPFG